MGLALACPLSPCRVSTANPARLAGHLYAIHKLRPEQAVELSRRPPLMWREPVEASYGLGMSRAHREKLRQAALAQWADPVQRCRLLVAARSPEKRAKLSAASTRDWQEHRERRVAMNRALWTPEFYANHRQAMQRPGLKERRRAWALSQWNGDPAIRAIRAANLHSPEARKKHQAAMRRLGQTRSHLAKLRQIAAEFWTPERCAAHRALLNQPAHRALLRQKVAERQRDPAFRRRFLAAMRDQKFRERMSAAIKAKWADPAWRAKRAAKNSA